MKSLSHVRLLATPWTAAYQAPLSMGFSRQEYWSGVPLPSPEFEPKKVKTRVSLLLLAILERPFQNPACSVSQDISLEVWLGDISVESNLH